jgi:hypothetical protein
MNKFDVRRANAAVKAAEAQVAGLNYDYQSEINKITMAEKKFNNFRVDLYNKDIAAAKAAGNMREVENLQRRLNNFQERLVDERIAFEAASARNNYFDALSKAAIQNTIASSTSSLQNKTSSLATGTNKIAESQATAVSAAQVSQGSANLSAYDAAKAAREEIDKNMNELRASGASKEAIQAAENARHAALQVEISAANAVASTNRTAVQQAVQQAAQEASAAAQQVAQEVAQEAAAAAAAQAAKVATLEALKAVAGTPGMSQWDVQRAQAAVKAAEAELAGTEYDLDHALNTINQNKAYEESGGTPNQSGRTWDGH